MPTRRRKTHKNYFRFTIFLIVVLLAAAGIFALVNHKKGSNTTATTKTKSTTSTVKKKPKVEAIKKDPNPTNIPVLMYHSIAYEKGNDLRVPPEKFRQELQIIKDNGFTPITLDELYSHFNDEAALPQEPIVITPDDGYRDNDEVVLPQKPIVITLDDGYRDNYENALPILKEFGFKATVFVITCQIDSGSDFMTSSQLKEMNANRIDIECHTVTHPHLKDLSHDKQLVELKDSKAKLEKILNKKINYIAYPYGSYNDDTLKIAQNLGYKMAVTTNEGLANKAQGIYALDRMYISASNSLEYFKKQITGEIK